MKDLVLEFRRVPRQCPTVPFKMAGMKNRLNDVVADEVVVVLAIFGDARLVRVRGRVHLEGGSMADRMEALDWASVNLTEPVAAARAVCRRK